MAEFLALSTGKLWIIKDYQLWMLSRKVAEFPALSTDKLWILSRRVAVFLLYLLANYQYFQRKVAGFPALSTGKFRIHKDYQFWILSRRMSQFLPGIPENFLPPSPAVPLVWSPQWAKGQVAFPAEIPTLEAGFWEAWNIPNLRLPKGVPAGMNPARHMQTLSEVFSHFFTSTLPFPGPRQRPKIN